ncbi:MAG: SEC-C domain-containing protein [Elusimicrobiales bacterium]|nr:SEC-C domain-containing protein [Elusimicrobiales bacterium]
MAWDFIKKITGKEEDKKTEAAKLEGKSDKPVSEKTDEELEAEINAISPDILKQAKEPAQKAMIIRIYRRLLEAGIDVNDDKAVKKWVMKHPEIIRGGDVIQVKTVHREQPKIGRNDPCPCGSGKKYKKCCGK